MIRDFEKVIAALKHWNLHLKDPTKDENFQSRLVIQKLVYICQALGVQLKKYHFTLYKNGPYSPDLTNDYYNNPQLFNALKTDYKPKSDEINTFTKIRETILSHPLNDRHQADLLEAVSTILFLKKKKPAFLDDALFENTKLEKPFLSDKTIVIAINIVKKLTFKPEYLTDEIKEEIGLWDKAEE